MILDLLTIWIWDLSTSMASRCISNTMYGWSDYIGLAYQGLMPVVSGIILILLVISGSVHE